MATIIQAVAELASPAKLRYYPEAASQSFKKGEYVYLVAGKLTVCPSDAINIAGMAAQDASGTTDTAIAIYIAEPGVMFLMNVGHGTPASAVTAITLVGSKFGLLVASNKHYCDIGDTSNVRFIVKDLSPRDAVGDQYGRVLVGVLDEYSQLSSTTS